MTSGDQEPLFELNTSTPEEEQPQHVPKPARSAPRTPRDEEALRARLDEMADKTGSYLLARAALGLPLEDEDHEDDTKPAGRRHLPGKPLSYPKRGNVRDFHDGGRADEHRGGMGAPELGSEADDIMRQRLPELQSQRDRIVEENIRNGFEDDVIASEYVTTDAARSRALGRYRAHLERHYPDMSTEDLNDVLADFAETLLPPSPLQ